MTELRWLLVEVTVHVAVIVAMYHVRHYFLN